MKEFEQEDEESDKQVTSKPKSVINDDNAASQMADSEMVIHAPKTPIHKVTKEHTRLKTSEAPQRDAFQDNIDNKSSEI